MDHDATPNPSAHNRFQILPPLSSEDYERLKASIKERGVEVPVIVDEDGNILDGHNRVAIAKELGIACRTEVRKGLASHEKRILAAELNAARRQLTDAQKVELGRQIEPDIAERARLRQGARTDLRTSGTTVPEVKPEQRARDEVAKTVGLGSGRSYERQKAAIVVAEKTLGAKAVKQRVDSGSTVREIARETIQVKRAQSNALIDNAVDNEDVEDRRVRLKVQLSSGMKKAHELVMLKPESIAEVVDDDIRERIDYYFPKYRQWMDDVERALPRGLRAVS